MPSRLVKVVPLEPAELAKYREAEKQLGVSCAVYEGRKKEIFALLEAMKQKYDTDYQKNSTQQRDRYHAEVKDGCVVIMLD